MHTKPTHKRNTTIDIARLLGAVLTVFFHTWIVLFGFEVMFPSSITSAFGHLLRPSGVFWLLAYIGGSAVPLFLALSGYCVSQSRRPWKQWLRRRLSSLLPLYWLSFFLFVPLVSLLWRAFPSFFTTTLAVKPTAISIIAAFFLLQNSHITVFNSPVPSWYFIPILLQLYLLFPVLRFATTKYSWKILLMSLFISQLIWNIVILGVAIALPDWYPLLRFSAFSYIFLYYFSFLLGTRKARVHPTFGVILLIFGCISRITTHSYFLITDVVLGIGYLSVAIYLAELLERKSPRLGTHLSHLGKKYSYILYLWHQPLLYLIGAFWLATFR